MLLSRPLHLQLVRPTYLSIVSVIASCEHEKKVISERKNGKGQVIRWLGYGDPIRYWTANDLKNVTAILLGLFYTILLVDCYF